MHFSSTLFAAALVTAAHAQGVVPSGFTPTARNKLDVFFNSTSITTPGQPMTKAETETQPKLAINNAMANASETYMFVMIDLDVPPAEGSTERRTLLHAMITGYKATKQQLSSSARLLATTEKGPATYLGPSPPVTDDMPHRYVELLFAQPMKLDVTPQDFADTSNRIGFNIVEFMTRNKIAAPLAGNFFTVDGKATAKGAKGTASASMGMPNPTSTAPPPFTGIGRKVDISWGLAGVLCGLVVLVV